MYLPGFEAIADDLHTTIEHIQLSLTAFFVGIALGQMIYGPLLDRFGRRIPLIAGLLLYIGASILCALTHSADSLIFFRLIQALGSCAGMVASRALVRDYFPPTETARVFSMLMLVIGVSPIVAPTVGGYITHFWGWQYVFVLLAIITLLILIGVWLLLPDKRGPDRQMSLMPAPIIKSFWQVMKLRQFYVYAIAGGFASAGLYAYISGSSYVMMGIYGISETQYGWAFGILAGGLITSSQVNNLVLKKYSSEVISKNALMIQAMAGITMVTLTLTGTINLYLLIGLIFCYLSCQGFVFPNTSALALNPFSRLAGSASALLGTIQMSIGAFASFLVSLLHDNTALPMVEVMAGCSTLSFGILLLVAKANNKTIATV